jgi:hypothetical protein
MIITINISKVIIIIFMITMVFKVIFNWLFDQREKDD